MKSLTSTTACSSNRHKLVLTRIERLPGKPISSIFRCLDLFFTDIIYSQSLQRENFTMISSFSFLKWWHVSLSSGDTLLLIFLKMISILRFNSLLWTLSRIPTTSRYSPLEDWAFAFPYQLVFLIATNWSASQRYF